MQYDAITVDILTMHNTGPQLFLCIVRFYAGRNVSQIVTICDLCQTCHTSTIIGENWEVPHIYMVSTFMGERLLLKKELKDVCLTEFTWTMWGCTHPKESQGICPYLKSAILDKGLHMIHPKWKLAVNLANIGMEKCWKFWLQYTKSTLG